MRSTECETAKPGIYLGPELRAEAGAGHTFSETSGPEPLGRASGRNGGWAKGSFTYQTLRKRTFREELGD